MTNAVQINRSTWNHSNITSILASMLVAVFIALVFLITRFLQEKALAADRSLELDRRQQIYRKEKERTEEVCSLIALKTFRYARPLLSFRFRSELS